MKTKNLKTVELGALFIVAVIMGITIIVSNRYNAAIPAGSIENKLNLADAYLPEINNAPGYSASWGKEYKYIAELYSSADDVIIADVTGQSKEYMSGHVPLTNTDVTIVKSMKGILTEGNTATVVETGSASTNMSIDGVPLLKQKMKVILFVRIIDENKLVILNDYAGKYFIDKDAHISFSGNYTARKPVAINLVHDGMSLDDFLKSIAELG